MPFTSFAIRVLMLSALSVVLLTGAHPTSAQAAPPVPVLASVIAVETPANSLYLNGQGFTPGGLVYVELRDSRDGHTRHHFWMTAAISGQPNGTLDPARPAGDTDVFRLTVPIAASTAYGEHGSQDPANGFDGNAVSHAPQSVPEDGITMTRRLACDGHLTARAYDRVAEAWSAAIVVTAWC